MAAPDATPPNSNPLRQAFRTLVPRPLRAALHAAIVAPTRWPGMIARQLRRAGWKIAESMSPPRQPGLFFWQLRRAPGRFIKGLGHATWGAWDRRMLRNNAFSPLRRLFGGKAPEALDQPSFPQALARLAGHDLGIRSIINLGAGAGGDTAFVQRTWPEARTLLVEMDAAYERTYRELQQLVPDLAWDICAAGPEDKLGRMQKSDMGGVGGALDLAGDAAAGADVRVKRLDTLVREHQMPAPYFLRFDTHGFELDILSGATETLPQTALVQMECYNFKLGFTGGKNLTFDEMSLHMKSLGFRCVDMCDPLYRPGDRALWQMHLFFIRADHPLWANPGFTAPRAEVR